MIVDIKNVSKIYDQAGHNIPIFKDLNFSLDTPTSIAIVGKSGSGKTTLLSLMSGLEKPDEGEINLLGQDITKLAPKELGKYRANNFSIIFQQFHLLPMLSAVENVMIALELKGEKNAYEKSMEVLKVVGLEERADHLPHQLSGGECQRVALARGVVTQPKILFADEPSGNLDEVTGKEVTALMFDLVEKNNTTLFLVTHDEALAAKCNQVYKLHNKTLVKES